jgi:hypothetical protein
VSSSSEDCLMFQQDSAVAKLRCYVTARDFGGMAQSPSICP